MISWNEIDTVLLDMDGTLLDLQFDNYFWLTYLPMRVSEIHNEPYEATEKRIVEAISSVKGTIDWYSMLYWQQQFEVDVIGIKNEIRKQTAWREGAEQFLLSLRKMGKQVVIITNADAYSLSLKLKTIPLYDYADDIISAHTFGLPKEQQGLWQAVQSFLNFDPAKTAFFDDTQKVLQAAHEFGIAHCFAIAQPDSAQPAVTESDFPLVHSFSSLVD